MKKLSIPAALILALAAVIAAGSVSFLGPCVHEDGSFGSCHWAGQAMLGLGCLMAVLALLVFAQKNSAGKAALFLALAFSAALGILFPGTLISLCRMSAMRCRAIMQPAMMILCALIAAAAFAGWLLARRESK